MMPLGKLGRIVAGNAVRNRGEFALSTFGIVVGIAAFVFFLGLSDGVRTVVLGEIFPLERLEVVAPKTRVAGRTYGKRLDDTAVERIRARPEVAEAVPRMQLIFPARGDGSFEGREIRFEVGGFTDGIGAAFVANEAFAEYFRDWESPEQRAKLKRCSQRITWYCPTEGYTCKADRRCHPPAATGAAPASSAGALASCQPRPRYTCPNRARYYCDQRDRKCHHRVPVIVSSTLLEIYNASFAESHGLPAIGALEEFIFERGLERMGFAIGLGETYIAGSNSAITAPTRKVGAVVVGISPKAMRIGMTVPIGYIKRWNREYVSKEAAGTYSSIIVTLKHRDHTASFSAWLRNAEGLELEDSQGERFAMAIFIVTMLFVLISFVIVAISAINIAHTFFMQVSERRREIGLLRAVGATTADVRLIILGEAGLVGLVGGSLGTGLALAAAALVDAASRVWLPDFPFKPDTYFGFPWFVIAGGILFAVLFSIVGGFLPARRAARMEPAQALAAR